MKYHTDRALTFLVKLMCNKVITMTFPSNNKGVYGMNATRTVETGYETWWPSITGAIITLFFGIAALFWPQLTVMTLVYLFSAFIIAHGIVRLIEGLMSIRTRGTWWLTALLGALGIGVGVFLIRHIDVTLATFILLVGFVLIAQGFLEIILALVGGTDVTGRSNKALLWIVGLSGILAGIFILMQPVAGGIAFVWILGLYAVITGILELAIALEVRSGATA